MWLNSFNVCWAQQIKLFLTKYSFCHPLRRPLDSAAPDDGATRQPPPPPLRPINSLFFPKYFFFPPPPPPLGPPPPGGGAPPPTPPPPSYAPMCIIIFHHTQKIKNLPLKHSNISEVCFALGTNLSKHIQHTRVFQYGSPSPYSMPWRYRRDVHAHLHPVWTSALKGGGWSTPGADRYTIGNSPWPL